MLLDIRAAFDEMVTELDWMDAGTRARAHRKLHAMRPFVGFPDWITNSKELDKFYEGVSFFPTIACLRTITSTYTSWPSCENCKTRSV